jgi:hypothetical protein
LDITPQQLDELRLGALTAIDGLWFMAVEKKHGFDQALELDLEVWRDYGVIVTKRISRMLGISLDPDDPPDLQTTSSLMEALCLIDGTQCKGEVVSDSELIIRVSHCPWFENLRRSGRQDHVPCEEIDNTIFRHWLEAIDPGIDFEITHSLPRGDDHCEWIIRRRGRS